MLPVIGVFPYHIISSLFAVFGIDFEARVRARDGSGILFSAEGGRKKDIAYSPVPAKIEGGCCGDSEAGRCP